MRSTKARPRPLAPHATAGRVPGRAVTAQAPGKASNDARQAGMPSPSPSARPGRSGAAGLVAVLAVAVHNTKEFDTNIARDCAVTDKNIGGDRRAVQRRHYWIA